MKLTNADKASLSIGSKLKTTRQIATIAGKMLITETYTVIGRRNAPNGVKLRLLSQYGSRANDVDFERGASWEAIEEAAIDQS